MLTINLGTLGVTEEQLTNAILKELGISRKEAIKQLAEKLGVDLPTSGAAVLNGGERVQTSQGEAQAQLLSREDVATLKRAGSILSNLGAA